MGALLDALIAESGNAAANLRFSEECATRPAANFANPAKQRAEHVPRFANSQDSQGFDPEKLSVQAARLLVALRKAGLPDAWMGLDHGDLSSLDAAGLRSYVQAFDETQEREKGKRPPDETAKVLCRSCGPVWIAPEVAKLAPIVGGWPRVLGCPWCHVKNRRAIPYSTVKCGECRHFVRDPVNPGAGVGRCGIDRQPKESEPMHYPEARRECEKFNPMEARQCQ